MIFIYQYRVSDGSYREDMVEAANRDEAFRVLRKNGIRPSKLWTKEIGFGVVQNDKGVTGFGKRWLFAVAFVASAVSLGLALLLTDKTEGSAKRPPERGIVSNIIEIKEGFRIAKPRPRKQLGVQLDQEKILKAFKHPAEVYLASFAQPGRSVEIASNDEVNALSEDLYDALEDVIQISPGDSRELVDLKRIVAGMKDDAAMLLASGKTPEDVFDWFAARQQMEMEHRASIVNAVSDDPDGLISADKKLKAMGFAPISK